MGQRLRVLSVAYPFIPVGGQCPGGPQEFLRRLDRQLVEAGHESTVLAEEGSSVCGQLVAMGASFPAKSSPEVWSEYRTAIAQLLWQRHFDLVHMHGFDFLEYVPQEPVPVLVSLHWPLRWYPQEIRGMKRPATYLHLIGEGEEAPGSFSAGALNRSAAAKRRHRDYALLLESSPAEKALAAKVAFQAGVPLLAAGDCRDLLHRRGCHFLGSFSSSRTGRLLAGARCLLSFEQSDCFGAMAALGYGTPVVGFRAPALDAVIKNGRNGFLVQEEQQMAGAVLACGRLAARPGPAPRRSQALVEECVELCRRVVESDHERAF